MVFSDFFGRKNDCWEFLSTKDRHVATGLEGVGFNKLGVEIFRRICGNSGAELLVSSKLREIGAKDTLGGRRVDLVVKHGGKVIKILSCLNGNRILWRGLELFLIFHNRAGGNENEEDQAWNNPPSHFDIVAAINLRRFLEMVFGTTRAKPDQHINEHCNDDSKNAKAHEEHEVSRLEEKLGRTRERLEYVRNSMNLRDRGSFWFGSEGTSSTDEQQKYSGRSASELS